MIVCLVIDLILKNSLDFNLQTLSCTCVQDYKNRNFYSFLFQSLNLHYLLFFNVQEVAYTLSIAVHYNNMVVATICSMARFLWHLLCLLL